MAANLSEGAILKTLKNLLKRVVSILLIPLLVIGGLPLGTNNVFADEGDDTPPIVVPEDAPAHKKKLVDNGDGTYTLSLSVTGKASSSTTQEVTKSNVILLLDVSNSMTTTANGYNGTRLEAEKNALTKTDGIIEKLLANNTSDVTDAIELYGISFGQKGAVAWDWSTNKEAINNTINNLTIGERGTNWEEALMLAKQAADAKKLVEPDDNTFVILLTDGQPTTHSNSYNVSTNYSTEWGYARDDARAIVEAGYTLYSIYTFGPTNVGNNTTCNTMNTGGSICLKGLVNYAYTGAGDANSALPSNYAQYFYDATDTQALIDALEAIVDEISTSVGYTNIAMTDGLTDLTSSMKVDGKISNLTYTRSGGNYGSGMVWTDAPEATTTNGTVNWNLGSRVLEDGVTYTVSFLVWPSQESYDLVADLNNGKKSYDSLSASQKASIINKNGVYTLKTNTDYPTLTYSTVTTTTSNAGTETAVSTPTTFSIQNPDPVGLKNEKLTLEKKWEDSLDPSQREEVNGEVTLDLYMDGQPYEESIKLTEEGEWKLANYISIAPGILISNESASYNLLKAGHTEYSFDGKTYIILETGHDYYFAEEDINNHFELTNYIYHPMLVDNVMTNVFFTRDGSGNITGIEKFEVMSSVSATNTLKGGINIEKKVVDNNNKSVDTNDSFEITAHLVGTDGKPYKYDYRFYYGEKNPEYESHIVYNTDGSVKYSRTDHVFGTGDLTETLYIGDTIRIVNVDAGVEYYVEETAKAGYDPNPVITYKEKYGDDDNSTSSAATPDGYYVVSGNTASSVTVTNKFLDEKTEVDFEKTWYGADGKVLSGKTLPGSITVELFKKGADGEVVSTGKTETATAETSWKASFTNLPKYDNGVEIVYSIKESAIDGATYNDQHDAFFEYDTEENNGKHAVVGRWKAMTFEDYILRNTWTPATESVSGLTSFNIKKIDASTREPLQGATFELKLSDGSTISRTTNENGEAIFNGLDAGEYSLKETAAPTDYQAVSAEPTISITKIKRLNQVDLANLNNIFEYVFSISATEVTGYTYDTGSRTYTVKNEPVPYSDINVAKVWNDGEDRDGLRKNYANYYVAVKNNSGKYVAYQKLVLEDKDDYEFAHLPKKTVNGEDITYEIVEASTCSGSGNNISCTEFSGDDDYTVTIKDGTITNKHDPALYNEDGKLTVEKDWSGEGNELVRPVTIQIQLYADGVAYENPVTISKANEWKWTYEGLYKFDDGEEIEYSVEELKLGESAFGKNETTIVVYKEDGKTLDGKWEKSVSGFNVTNTWTKATEEIEYDGASEFSIKKVDEDYKEMSGVTFEVNGEKKTTDKDGLIKVTVPISTKEKEESFEYEISEYETKEGYDLVNGSATISVSCTSEIKGSNASTLVNTYTKTCTFAEGEDSAKEYVWDGEEYTVTIVNNRSMADSLTIRKEFSGVTEAALKRNELKFTLTGPDDFEEQEIFFKDFSKIDEGVYEYKVTEKIPTGTYKVVESGAEFEGLLELEVTGEDNKEKTVASGDVVKFTIVNTYSEINDVSFKVKKEWDDDSDRDGIRPDGLKVTLRQSDSDYETVTLTAGEWSYEWTGLPRAGKDAVAYEYSVTEENVGDYTSDGGKMENGVFTFTNKYDPKLYEGTGELTVGKIWSGEGNDLVKPTTIQIQLYANGEAYKEPVTISEATGWKYKYEGLYENEGGEKIEYTVEEIKLGDTAFGDNESVIVVYEEDDEKLKGKWEKSVDGFDITNTWTEADETIEYEGATVLTISKVDENDEPLSDVIFMINEEEAVTDENGIIIIDLPMSDDEKEETFEFVISEEETVEGYDLAEGSATIIVTCMSEFAFADVDTMTNVYTKTCTFTTEGDEAYTWDEEDLNLTVVNKRTIDPCEDGGGCGGGDVTPPETGRLTEADGGADASTDLMMIGGLTIIMFAAFEVVRNKRKR